MKKLAKVAKHKLLKVEVTAGASDAQGVVLEAKKGAKVISSVDFGSPAKTAKKLK